MKFATQITLYGEKAISNTFNDVNEAFKACDELNKAFRKRFQELKEDLVDVIVIPV